MQLLPEDVMGKHVLSFLTLREVVRLDSSLVNQKLRQFLHASFHRSILNGAIDFRHLKWCKFRGCSTKTLRVTGALDNDALCHDTYRHEILQVCTTALVSEHALRRFLTAGDDCKVLNIRTFYCMRPHHLLPIESDLSLLEINADGNTYLQEDILIGLVKHCPHLRVINARRCFRFTKKIPLALAEHCPHLREVVLYTRDQSWDEHTVLPSNGYSELFGSCPDLEVVECSSRFTIQNIQTLADSCSKLNSVSLHMICVWDETHVALAYAALVALAQRNRSIHTLQLSSISRFTDASLLAVARFLPNLHTFCLDYCEASLTGLVAIRHSCTKLKTFEVYRHRCPLNFTDIFDYGLLQLSILSTLSIHSTSLTDVKLVHLAQINPHMRALCINSFYFEQGDVVSSHALCEALCYLPNLETFSVGRYLPPNFPHGTVLRLEDSVLYALTQHCRSLTSVHISGHENLSNDAMTSLLNLTLLSSLHTGRCANLLNSALVTIAERCPLLAEVNLSHCPRLSNVGLSALARNCRRLTRLVLQNCNGMRNGDVQLLVRQARDLEVLDIGQNSQLTFHAVSELPQYCPCMRSLRLYRVFRKPIELEFFAAYRNNKRYFDIVLGWSDELSHPLAI